VNSLQIVNRPLQRQLRAIAVALRAGSVERTREHAAQAVALVNEATDLTLRPEDLLGALAEGATLHRSGEEVIERLLETGVRRRLEAQGALVVEDGEPHFTRDDEQLRLDVRALLGVSRDSLLDTDPRWSDLLA
jgi:hypothetical protein